MVHFATGSTSCDQLFAILFPFCASPFYILRIYGFGLNLSAVSENFPQFSTIKGAFRENQMHAKVYIVIPIEKQILLALRNRRTSQRQDMEENIGPISILIPYYFCASLLANKGCKFSLLPAG